MNFKQEELIKELEQKLKDRFSDVTIDGYWEKSDDTIAIWVSTPEDNIWEIAEAMAPLSVDILSKYGYLIYIVPGRREKAMTAQAT